MQSEEDEQIRHVVSLKKQEFRVNIRQKKMAADFKSRRLKLSQNLAQQPHNPTNINHSYLMQHPFSNQSINSNYPSSDFLHMTQQTDLSNLDFNNNLAASIACVSSLIQSNLQSSNISEATYLLTYFHDWLSSQLEKNLIEKIEEMLQQFLQYNVHLICAEIISKTTLDVNQIVDDNNSSTENNNNCNKNIIEHSNQLSQHGEHEMNEETVFLPYKLLAQISMVMAKGQLEEMIHQQRFLASIDHILSHSNSLVILDNVFHILGNLASDNEKNEIGAYFCELLISIDAVSKSIGTFERIGQSEMVDVFLSSFLFFSQNIVNYTPESHREGVFQLLPTLMHILRCAKKTQTKHYCITILGNLIASSPQILVNFSDEDYDSLIELLQRNPKCLSTSLNFIKTIVSEGSDEFVIPLIERGIVAILVSILQFGELKNKRIAAFTLSNLAVSVENASDHVISMFLQDESYNQIMSAIIDSDISVRRELTFFICNIAMYTPSRKSAYLADEKSVLEFLNHIFTQYQENMEIILSALQSFETFYQNLAVTTPPETFEVYAKKIKEIGLEVWIEDLAMHSNKEIAATAESIIASIHTSQNNITASQSSEQKIETEEVQVKQQSILTLGNGYKQAKQTLKSSAFPTKFYDD